MLCPPDPTDRAAHDADEASKSAGSVSAAHPVEPLANRLDKPAPDDRDVPRPIGPERLKAIREAIRNGTYPSDADVVGGLVRMFRKPESPPERPAGS